VAARKMPRTRQDYTSIETETMSKPKDRASGCVWTALIQILKSPGLRCGILGGKAMGRISFFPTTYNFFMQISSTIIADAGKTLAIIAAINLSRGNLNWSVVVSLELKLPPIRDFLITYALPQSHFTFQCNLL